MSRNKWISPAFTGFAVGMTIICCAFVNVASAQTRDDYDWSFEPDAELGPPRHVVCRRWNGSTHRVQAGWLNRTTLQQLFDDGILRATNDVVLVLDADNGYVPVLDAPLAEQAVYIYRSVGVCEGAYSDVSGQIFQADLYLITRPLIPFLQDLRDLLANFAGHLAGTLATGGTSAPAAIASFLEGKIVGGILSTGWELVSASVTSSLDAPQHSKEEMISFMRTTLVTYMEEYRASLKCIDQTSDHWLASIPFGENATFEEAVAFRICELRYDSLNGSTSFNAVDQKAFSTDASSLFAEGIEGFIGGATGGLIEQLSVARPPLLDLSWARSKLVTTLNLAPGSIAEQVLGRIPSDQIVGSIPVKTLEGALTGTIIPGFWLAVDREERPDDYDEWRAFLEDWDSDARSALDAYTADFVLSRWGHVELITNLFLASAVELDRQASGPGALPGSVVLAWTAPTFASGKTADIYEVRYMRYNGFVENIRHAWDTAPPYEPASTMQPNSPGQPEALDITDLRPSTPHLFMVRARSPSGVMTPIREGIVIESSADPSAMRLWNACRNPINIDIGTTSITFSIRYRHDQGLPPATAQLVFDDDSRPMSRVAGDYATGAEYRVVVSGLSLPEGSMHTYYFEFIDEAGNLRREPPTAPDLPRTFTVNTVLRSSSWSPDAGQSPRGFTFRVVYAHPGGIIPTQRQLIVDGNRYDMNFVAGDYRSSAIFERRVVIGAGEHDYSFEFHDGTSTIRLPTSGPPFAGPTVASFRNVGLLLTQGSPPSTMVGGTPLSVGVAVRNNGSILETGLSIHWTVNGSPVEPAVDIETLPPGVASDQKVLTWTPPIQDSYSAPFILAVDILGAPDDTDPSDNYMEWWIDVTPPPGSISGTVRDELNLPVPGAMVSVVTGPEQASAQTDVDGNYRLTGLPPGEYTILAQTDDGRISDVHPPITVHAGQDTPLVILDLGTSNIVQLTPSGDEDSVPAWSPDGTRIAYYHRDWNDDNTSYVGTWRIRRLNDGTEWMCPDFLSGGNFGKPQWVDNETLLIPDVQALPYGEGIFKVHTPDCAVVDLLPRQLPEGYIGTFTYAPGSSRMYYTVASAIWSCRISDFGDRRLFAQISTSTLAASHDGQLLATHAGVIGIDNGEYLPTPNWPSGSNWQTISWLPSDEGLVYSKNALKLHTYFLDGRDITLTFGNSAENYPDVRPVGTTLIVFQSNMNQDWNSWPLFTLEFDPSAWACAFSSVAQVAERITPNGDGLDDALSISYSLTCDAAVTLKIYGFDGKWIATPVKAQAQSAGPNALSWDGSGDNGLVVPSGMYFWTLDAQDDAGGTALPYRGRVTVVKNDVYVGGAEGTLSPDNTWIAYLNTSLPNSLLAAGVDGSNETVVYTAPDGHDLAHPSISRNNTTIAFMEQWDDQNITAIARIERDGSGLQFIANPDDHLDHAMLGDLGNAAKQWNDPSWSRSSDELVARVTWRLSSSESPNDVCIMNADGSNKLVLTQTGHDGTHMWPVFAADGMSIIFASDENTTPPNLFTDLFIVPASGGAHAAVTNWLGWEDAPHQTCDGSHLLFGATLLQSWVGANHDLFVMNMDTMQWRPLLGNTFEAHPSCDGRLLLTRNGALVTLDHSLIGGTVEGFVVDEDGQAVESATVEARSGQDLVGIAVSNALGAYRAADLPIGSLLVTARRRGYREGEPVSVTTSAGVMTPNVDLTLTELPAALVSSIQLNARYAGTVQLAAEALSTNVSSVAYEFRRQDDADWTPLGTVSDPPYVQLWDTNDVVAAGQEMQAEVRAIASGVGDVADADPVAITLVVDRIPPISDITTPSPGQTVGTRAVNLSVQTDSDADRVVVDYRHASQPGASWKALAETDQLTESEGGMMVTLALATEFLPGVNYELRAWAVDEAGNVETPVSTVSVVAGLDGDGDADADVDLIDVAHFQRCFGMTAAHWDDTCGVFNFDGSSLIDLADWAAFVQVVMGP